MVGFDEIPFSCKEGPFKPFNQTLQCSNPPPPKAVSATLWVFNLYGKWLVVLAHSWLICFLDVFLEKTKQNNVLIQTKWCFSGHESHSRKDPQKTITSFKYINKFTKKQPKPFQIWNVFHATELLHWPQGFAFLTRSYFYHLKRHIPNEISRIFSWKVTVFSPL